MRFWFAILIICLFPITLLADDTDVWNLHLFGGGVTYCDEDGCFGPTGVAFGGTFGRSINQRLSLEGEFTYACTWEDLEPQIDPVTGASYITELERERIWSGGSLLIRLSDPEVRSDFYAIIGAVGAHEVQKRVPPEGIPAPPDVDTSIRFGIATGVGYNWWFAENWGIRPEARFYWIFQDDLSALRYTAGLLRRF